MKNFKLFSSVLSVVMIFAGISPSLGAPDKTNKYTELKSQYQNASPPPFYRSLLERQINTLPGKPDTTNPSSKFVSENQRLRIKSRRLPDNYEFAKTFAAIPRNVWETAAKAESDAAIEKLLTPRLNPDYLIALAVLRNPGLQAARQRIKSRLNEYEQAANLQDILNQYSAFTEALNTRIGPARQRPMLSMSYPYPGMTSLRGEIIDQDIALLNNEYQTQQRNLISEINGSYHELAYLGKAEDISQETLALLNSMRETSQTMYKTGKASFTDVINIQMKIDILNETIATLRQNQDLILTRYREILDLPPGFALGKADMFSKNKIIKPIPELFRLGLSGSLELKTLNLKLNKMKLMITMLEKMSYPEFASPASLFQNREALMNGSEKSLPPFPDQPLTALKPWYGSNDAYIKQLKDEYRALEYKLAEQQNKLKQQIEATLLKIDEYQRKKKLYLDVLLPQADQSLEVSQTGYQTGKVSFSDLLLAYNTWLNYHLDYHAAMKKLNQEQIMLEKITSANLFQEEESSNVK